MTTKTRKLKVIEIDASQYGEQAFRMIGNMEVKDYVKEQELDPVEDKSYIDNIKAIKELYKSETIVLGPQFPITTDVEVQIARDYIKDFQKNNPDHKLLYNSYIESPADAPEAIVPLFSKVPIIGFHKDNQIKHVNDIHAPLIWNETRKDNVFVSKFHWPEIENLVGGTFIIKLQKKSQGVYGIGKAFILSIRKEMELDEKVIASFWTESDNHGTHKDGSVDGKMWVTGSKSEDTNGIQYRAGQLLRTENYI